MLFLCVCVCVQRSLTAGCIKRLYVSHFAHYLCVYEYFFPAGEDKHFYNITYDMFCTNSRDTQECFNEST